MFKVVIPKNWYYSLHTVLGGLNMTEHVSKVYVGEDLNRLKQLINDGVAVMNEIETLKGGLSDTVKNVAEELDIKAAQLNKALRVYKDNMTYIFGS